MQNILLLVLLNNHIFHLLSSYVHLKHILVLEMLVLHKLQLHFLYLVFFVLIFPGNISQYLNQIDAFGLDTDKARLIRLFFQPVLVLWAIGSTGAYKAYKNK